MKILLPISMVLGLTIAAMFYVGHTFDDQQRSAELIAGELDEIQQQEGKQERNAPQAGHDSVAKELFVEVPESDAEWKKPIQKEAKKLLQGMFETILDAELRDGKVEMAFSLKNVSGEDLRITHGSGQQYDIIVHNEQEEEVYRWSNGKAFTMALIERGLHADEQLTYNETWHLVDNQGIRVPPGSYTIRVNMIFGSEAGTIHPEESESTAETVIVLD